MVRSLIGRLLCPVIATAAVFAAWDAEAGCCRGRRAACCKPCCEVVYETVYEPVCPAPCRPACPAPCPTVSCCPSEVVHHAHVVVEEVIVAPSRCCAATGPVTVIAESTVSVGDPVVAPRQATSRGRLVATPVSRQVR